MGYYSDVCLVMSRRGWEFMMDRLDNESDKFRDEFWTFMNRTENAEGLRVTDGIKVIEGTGEFENHREYEERMYFWSGVKWYEIEEYYPEICFISSVMRDMSKEDFFFDRMGEKDGDRECDGRMMDSAWTSSVERRMVVEAWI